MPSRSGFARAQRHLEPYRCPRDLRFCWIVISEIERYSQASGAWNHWYQQSTPCLRTQPRTNHGKPTSVIHRQTRPKISSSDIARQFGLIGKSRPMICENIAFNDQHQDKNRTAKEKGITSHTNPIENRAFVFPANLPWPFSKGHASL